MNILIVYSTHGGVAKECAEILASHLEKNNTLTLVNAREETIPEPQGFDAVVLGGAVRMGRINKNIRRYVKQYMSVLMSMPSAVYFCCGYPKQFDEYTEIIFPRRFTPSLGYYLFGGELKPDKLSGIDKIIVWFMRNSILSQDFEESDDKHNDLPEMIPENIILLAKEIRKIENNC